MPEDTHARRRGRAASATVATRLGWLLAVAACGASCAQGTPPPDLPPVRSVASLDLTAYLGRWYEIARLDERVQRGCAATETHYAASPRPGEIVIVNRCRRGGLRGEWREVRGRGRVQAGSGGARLRVNFFGPFWGDYWVLDRDDAYTYAAVGDPKRRHLWILSRTPAMAEPTYAELLARLAGQGWAVGELQRTPQPARPANMAVPSSG